MRLARFAAAWCGGLLAVFGALYVLATQRMLALAGLSDLAPTPLTDLRVMYGALQLAPGLFCLASFRRDDWLEPALGLATLTFAWVAALRVLGIALDGSASTYHVSALCIEIPTSALAAVAWRGLRRS